MPDYKTYSQSDSRWGSKNYDGSSMSNSGCGPTSVAMLAYAVDSSIDPWDVGKWMKDHGYAVPGWGSAWAGIPAAMKHFGLKDVKEIDSVSDVYDYIAKGYCAVFLMKAGSRGGCTWTTSGHFIAVTGYKHSDGKHYFYTRDSGFRSHTGWYCYENKMKGLIKKIWVGRVDGSSSKPKKKKKSKSSVPSYMKGKTYKTCVDCLNVREGAGVNYSTKSKKQLSANAQKHCNSKGQLNKGTEVTCLESKKVGKQVWIKIPSGWICAYNGTEKYVK